jgi:hypothetical protein
MNFKTLKLPLGYQPQHASIVNLTKILLLNSCLCTFNPLLAADMDEEPLSSPRFERLTHDLQLSSEQRAELSAIYNEKREKIREVRQETQDRIEEILTEEQLAKWESLKKRVLR